MNIRLNALKNYNTRATAPVSKVNEAKLSSAKTQNSGKTDMVSISANASDFSAAKIQNEISAEVNSLSSGERIAEIKKQISEGTYNVSSQDIAASILIGSSCNVISVSMTEKALSALPAETALFISNTLACRLFAQSREMSSGVISPPDL